MRIHILTTWLFVVLIASAWGDSQAEALTQVVQQVDLAVALKAPQHVAPDSEFVYNVSYNNLLPGAIPADAWLELSLPAGTSFVQAVDNDGNPLPPASMNGGTLTWNIVDLPVGCCWNHIWVTVQVDPLLPEATLLVGQATIGSSLPDSDPSNDTATASSEVCDMAGSTKQAQAGPFKPGDVVTYTVTLRLAARQGVGVVQQRMVDLIDDLPPPNQVRFLGWVGAPSGSYQNQQLRWQGLVKANQPVQLQYRLGIEAALPPGGVITNQARLQWAGGELNLEPLDVSVYLSPDDHMFGSGGGQWQHTWGLTIDLPPGAVTDTTRFQFRPLFDQQPPDGTPPGWFYAHRAFELTAFQFGELHQFNQPITLTLEYQDQDVSGLQHTTLRLWYRQGPNDPWVMLGNPLSHQNGQISFNTDHLTEFALFGQGANQMHLPVIRK